MRHSRVTNHPDPFRSSGYSAVRSTATQRSQSSRGAACGNVTRGCAYRFGRRRPGTGARPTSRRLLTRVLLGGVRLELEADEALVAEDLGIVPRLDHVGVAWC